MKTAILYILITLFCSPDYTRPGQLINYEHSLCSILDSYKTDTVRISVVIDKSDYKLSLLSDTTILKEYPVVFGRNPVDDKLRQGDNCTPEGTFRMEAKYPHSKWSRFIWINYPTADSWKKHNLAIKNGIIPADARIGGEIGIHGVPDKMDFLIDIKFNWTAGCISLKNKDIKEIYQHISSSTPILIRK